MFLAFLFDLCVWFMSSRISFLDGEDEMNPELMNSSKNIDNLNDTNNNENENKLNLAQDDDELKNLKTIKDTSSKLENNDGNNNNNLLIEDCK